jgi:D-sedoheptulose 7-phosphate isomerase
MSFAQQFLAEVQQVTAQLNPAAIETLADELARIRERGGRLFILGVGGSAGNASHAVNDFSQDLRARMLCPHRQRLRIDGPDQ